MNPSSITSGAWSLNFWPVSIVASKRKVTFGDIEVGMDDEPEPGLADNGDLDTITAVRAIVTSRAPTR